MNDNNTKMEVDLLKIEQIQGLIPEPNNYGLPRCGCYVVNQDITNLYQSLVAVPLKHIDYQVDILNSIARITLEQVYTNPTHKYLELEYSVPIDQKVCIYSFKASFGDVEIQGKVKEREEAKKEYQEAIKEGKKAAIGTIDRDSKDVLNLKIGNVAPKQEVRLRIQYLYELDVSLNVFWKVMLQSKIWPRYTNNSWKHYFNNDQNKKFFATQIPNYTWSFKVTVNSSDKIVFAQSTTHKLSAIQQNEGKTQVTLVMQQSQLPNKDFIFIYTTQNSNKPVYVTSRTDTSQTLLVSFIPRFNNLELTDAEKMERQSTDYEVSLSHCKGEFIFFLDRSGSMSGSRIKEAIEALLFFLKSLPKDCYFNIVSFGSWFNLMFKESVANSTKNIELAISNLSSFGADMQGTVIYGALEQVLKKQKQIKGYPKHVFLLTDGQVDNTHKVLSLIKQQSKYSTVHGIGIGSGCSQQLIKGCSENGRGKYIFISDKEDSAEKIIQLLELALSPAITNFKVQYDSKAIETVIPNPNQMPYVLKNEPVNLYFLMKPGFSGDYSVNVEFTDPVTKKVEKQSISTRIPQQSNFEFLDKQAQHKKLSLLSEKLKQKGQPQSIMLMAKCQNMKQFIIKESVKHQVLCSETAFLCVEKNVNDGKAQQIMDSGSIKIQVPQPKYQEQIQQSIDNLLKNQAMMLQNLSCSTAMARQCHQIDQIDSLMECSSDLRSTSKQFYKTSKAKKSSIGSSISDTFSKGVQSIGNAFRSFGKLFKKQQKVDRVEEQQIPRKASPQMKMMEYDLKIQELCKDSQQKQQIDLFDQLQNQIKGCVSKIDIKQKEKQSVKEKEKEKVIQNKNIGPELLKLQTAEGNWRQEDLATIVHLLSINSNKFQEIVSKYKNSSLLLTILIIKYLQANKNAKYSLILKKAKEWVESQENEPKVTEEDKQKIKELLNI